MIVVHSIGPYMGMEIYWGVQYDIPVTDTKHISYAWLVEDLEPFRRSTWGCRLRFGSRALHLGRCVRSEDPHRRLPDVPVTDISTWRGPHDVQDQGSQEGADPGGEPLRQDGGGRPVPGAGGINWRVGPFGGGVPQSAESEGRLSGRATDTA